MLSHASDLRRVYHPQLWRDVWRTGNAGLYADLDIPRSTRLRIPAIVIS